ncbi:DUF7793 family protein [Sanyastnella coralliicola]|uniref:DUF7793 family protein n=1 Tax=Sanyastnella coralliicola TaxID=3069118 RepID=UPI0027BA8B55|nr:hypothetical protein [Longitalea sp. SCSIO 12813]
MPEGKPTLDLGTAIVWFDRPDLVCVTVRNDQRMTVAEANQVIEWTTSISKGNKYKMLYIPEPGANISPELRDTLADPSRADRVIADAMVVANFPHRLLADFYLRFNKPAVPTKLFSNEEAARRWLETV